MSTEPAASKPDDASNEGAPLQVRPTLFIAIGGTGMEICMRLRRRLLNYAWAPKGKRYRMQSLAEFKAADFIQFDLDSGANIDSGRSKTEDLQYDLVKFADSDKIVEPFNIDKYIGSDDSLGRYPYIEEWIPLTPSKVRELKIDPSKGAGQIRAISRLYFFDKYPKIRQMIRTKLGSLKAGLSNTPDLQKLGLAIEQKRGRIVVVGSMAGGTGAGSFLDIGYLAKHVGEQVFDRCDVDLLFLSPSGFKSANLERTEANGYAALMELETLLTDGPSNYLKRWRTDESYTIPRYPYDGIFLLETGNIAGQVTSDVKDIYQMAADCFFFDFMSEQFASKKRSLASNQDQHKVKPYHPPINERKYGETRFSFRQSYSSFGVSVLSTGADLQEDIQQHELAAELLRAYFGVGPEYQKANAVDDKTLGDFIKTRLQLGSAPIEPPRQLERRKLASIGSVELTRSLLVITGKKVLDGIHQQTTEKLEAVRNQFARHDWKEQLRLVQRELEQTTITDIDTRSDTNEAKLTDRGTVLLRELKHGVETQLFEYLDNPDLGGLEYVLSFIEALKQKIDDGTTGYCKRLLSNEATLREWKSLLQAEIEETYSYLDQVSGNSWLGDNQKKAEAKLEHLKDDIAEYLNCHLQMVASHAAADVLQSLSAWLGTKTVDPTTLEARWSGLAGDFQEGKAAVTLMVSRLNTQVAVMKKDRGSQHAMRVTLPLEVIRSSRPEPRQLREWADEAMAELGKTKFVFEMLRGDANEAGKLINRMLAKAKAKLAGLTERKSLIDTLKELSPVERQAKFVKVLQCAFPWVNARELDNVKHYKLFMGVKDANAFARAFGNEVKQAASASGLTLDCEIVETGEDGQAICYCELSGYPLTMLRDLENWRVSYTKESHVTSAIPLHTHRRVAQFKHPMAPTDEELEEQKKDFAMFLRGVMTGVLTSRKGVYGFFQGRGDRVDIGQEALIRRDGIFDSFEQPIEDRISAVLDVDGEEGTAALYALCHHYLEYVYPPASYSDETDKTVTVKSMWTYIVEKMLDGTDDPDIQGYKWQLHTYDPHHVIEILLTKANINKWSQQVADSENDGPKGEIREVSDEDRRGAEHSYYVKRCLREGWQTAVKQLLAPAIATPQTTSIAGVGPAGMMPPPPPPPLPGRMVSVAIAGQQSGPYPEATIRTMIQSGQLNPDSTHVWWPGLANWVLIKDCPDLLATVPPPPPTGVT